jgi:hypothetical protein
MRNEQDKYKIRVFSADVLVASDNQMYVESMCEFANQKVFVRDPRLAGGESVSDFILRSDRLHCVTRRNLRCFNLFESRSDYAPILVP